MLYLNKKATPHALFKSNHPEAHAWGLTCLLILYQNKKSLSSFYTKKLIISEKIKFTESTLKSEIKNKISFLKKSIFKICGMSFHKKIFKHPYKWESVKEKYSYAGTN